MITIKTKNYTIPQLCALRQILSDGLKDIMAQRCVSDCAECMYNWVCNDIESTIEFLNKRIAEMKDKYSSK